MLALTAVALLACGAEPTPTLPFVIQPPPTATPAPTEQPATPGSSEDANGEESAPTPTEEPGLPAPTEPLSADHLGHLPDDPTELMFAVFDNSLLQVGQKMAHSHNDAFIPVLLEFMRFQQSQEARLTLASYMVRIRDKIPEGDFAVIPPGEDNWSYWVEWLASNPGLRPRRAMTAGKGNSLAS